MIDYTQNEYRSGFQHLGQRSTRKAIYSILYYTNYYILYTIYETTHSAEVVSVLGHIVGQVQACDDFW